MKYANHNIETRPICKLLALLLLTISLNITEAYADDGDNNIYPGGAMALSTTSKISNIEQKQAIAGEIVPTEDSDKLPRLKELVALEFQFDGEVYRYTHTRKSVTHLNELLDLLGKPNNAQLNSTVHIMFYFGQSFRDEVHRVSGFFALD